MFVDFARRLMFVHIPKTAGRTVRAHLLRHSESFANFWGETAGIDLAHLSVRESEAYLSPGFVDRATKFCFVRNPYDRLYSAFKERQYAPSFPRFVRDLYSRREFPLHCRPQHTFIHEAGRLRVERILRYEDFATEFRQLLLEFGFPVDVEAGSISDCHESSYMRHYDEVLISDAPVEPHPFKQ